jgi:hypothetical protein
LLVYLQKGDGTPLLIDACSMLQMVNGEIGMLGAHVVQLVAVGLKTVPGFATIQHPPMEEQIALEMQRIPKIATMETVQL